MTLSISQSDGGWLDNSGDGEARVCQLNWCMRTWSDVKGQYPNLCDLNTLILTQDCDRLTEA